MNDQKWWRVDMDACDGRGVFEHLAVALHALTDHDAFEKSDKFVAVTGLALDPRRPDIAGEPPRHTETMAVNTTGLRFEKILVKVEQGLRLALEQARLETDHGLTIGEQAEAAVRTMLRGHLPNGYGVGRGHVHDAYGDESLQTDVIIANPDHPLTYPEAEKSGIYVVDGVIRGRRGQGDTGPREAQRLHKKGTRFKELRMTIGPDDHVITTRHQARMKQIGLVPPYFVLVFDNKIAIDTLGERLRDASLIPPPEGKSWGPQDDCNEPQPPLDIVCILGHGVYLYRRPDNPLGMKVKDGPLLTSLDRCSCRRMHRWHGLWLGFTRQCLTC